MKGVRLTRIWRNLSIILESVGLDCYIDCLTYIHIYIFCNVFRMFLRDYFPFVESFVVYTIHLSLIKLGAKLVSNNLNFNSIEK